MLINLVILFTTNLEVKFLINKVRIYLNFGYISNIVENLVNNNQLNSNDPQVMIAKIVNLFLQQSQAIDNPYKVSPINTIKAI